MKTYIFKSGNHLDFQVSVETPKNIGYDKIDFENGCWIELPNDLFDYAQEIAYIPDAFDLLFPKKYYYLYDEKVIVLNAPLDASLYDLGKSYEDYLNGKFVELTEKQIHWYLHNNTAKPEQIWNMSMTLQNLEEVKAQKIKELYAFDNSTNVNSFIINNDIIGWFTPDERSNYSTSISSAKLLGVSMLTFCIGNKVMNVKTEDAEKMLAAIQLYADACFIVTKQHENAINSLKTVEAVSSYNFMTNYPNKLMFTL